MSALTPALAAALAAAGAALLVGPARTRPDGGPAVPRAPAVAAVLAGGPVALLVWLDGRRLALALIALGAGLGVGGLVRRARAARRADRLRVAVVEVAEALAGELRAGQPVQVALERCVDVWPAFGAVAGAGRLGADVPTALRRLAASPGAEGLGEVATAWQVSADSGAGLAASLTQVAETARARRATGHVVAAELSSAQATARLVALLPLVVLAMSSGVGGRPWRFLLDSSAGLACLAAGVGLALVGLWWIDRIAAAVQRR